MSSKSSLRGQVALVTGASRGIGRGIALQLGAAGATVYVTGRQAKQKNDNAQFPTLDSVAQEVANIFLFLFLIPRLGHQSRG
jgi:dehydrogenase/reductase SDR family protein 1